MSVSVGGIRAIVAFGAVRATGFRAIGATLHLLALAQPSTLDPKP